MYTISSGSQFIIPSGIVSPFGFLINDRPTSGGQDVLEKYLSDAKAVFTKQCDALLSTEHVFTEADAERLSIMLKLLMDARKTWQEEATTEN